LAAILLSSAVTCFAALFLGQAALRLAGASEWSWLAPAVGLSVAMLVAAPAIHVPGRCATVAILLGLLTIAAAVWCLRSPQHRPPLSGLLAAAPVALLVLVPFLAAGHGGILGVTVNNDMAAHLLFAEGIFSSAAREASPLPADYPLGPHALAATLAEGLGIELDAAFSGWTMAIPVINAWTVLAVARRATWFGKALLATVAGMPFLVAAYYGQGAFKEVVLAGLVLAVVLSLSGCGPRLGRGRWVPFALLLGGIVSVYSLAGLPWPLVIAGLWLAGLLAIQARGGALREVPRAVGRELPALGIGLVVLVVSLLPQAHRIWQFLTLRQGSGIAVDDLGNLIAPLSGWQAFGVWNSADFRLPASPAFTAGMWTAFVLALVLFGTYWAFRRGRWLLPLAAAGAMVIWRVSEHSQSPYVSAKALVIASPLLLMLAVLPLVDREPGRRPHWPWLLVPLLGLVLFLRVGSDSVRALRWSPVGPTGHARQLETFRPLVTGKPTLFLGNDEFINWELSGSPVQWTAVAATPELPLRPQKGWEYGQALDFDSLRAATLNDYEWIVTPRDAASSAPPPQLRLVRSTEDYRLWKRVGRIGERSILREGEWPGAVLRCDTKGVRAIIAAGGVAAVRRPPIVAPVASAAAGDTVSARLSLPVGEWELETPYTSPLPVEVTAPGLRATLPANLDRPGPRLPIGRITVHRRQPLSITFRVEDTALAPATAIATFNRVVATPAGSTDRVVPIGRACGKYVDWYRGR
jgi:hypothetical protein